MWGGNFLEKIIRPLLVFMLSFSIVGCGNSGEATYNETITSGIEYIIAEDYENAENAFEFALEENPEDECAQATLKQMTLYREALNEFERDNNEKALELAENVLKITEGSDEMNAQAKNLLEKTHVKIETELAEEKAEQEAEAAKLQAEKEQAEKERLQAEQEAAEKEAAEAEAASTEESYTYEDFKGIYGMFEGESYTSNLSVVYILSDHLLTDIVVEWMEYTAANITNVAIEDELIYIDYAGEDEGPNIYESGTFEARIEYKADGQKILMVNGHSMYEMTRDQFNAYGLTIAEESFEGL